MKSKFLTVSLILLVVTTASAQFYNFTTLAGQTGFYGSTDGPGTLARFFNPGAVAVDAAGNLYVADAGNHIIRRVTPDGSVTTLAGTAGQSGSTDGPGAAARFSGPAGLTVDTAGNVYVADAGNHTIRKVTAAGAVTTLAGTAGQSGYADGTGSAARFKAPADVAVDHAGNILVADTGNNTMRRITPAGVVTTLANPRLNYPTAVTVNDTGTIYVADLSRFTYAETTKRISSFSETGQMTTIAEFSDGVKMVTAVSYIEDPGVVDLVTDRAGNILMVDPNTSTIRRITPGGAVSLVAGAIFETGASEGPGHNARFFAPGGLAMDRDGNLYVADTTNQSIRRGAVGLVGFSQVTVVGHGASLSATGATGTIQWQVSTDHGTTWSNLANDTVYSGVNTGTLTLSATGAENDTKIYRYVATNNGVTTPSGPFNLIVVVAALPHPTGLAYYQGNVYASDSSTHAIQRFDDYRYGSEAHLVAGSSGQTGTSDGTGASARFNQPGGLAIAGDGSLTVADTAGGTIRRIGSDGKATTLAGSPVNRGNVDATGAAATFSSPRDVAQDATGTSYVADSLNHTIRKVTSAGVVTTLAGSSGNAGSSDGTGAAARFNNPCGVAVDGAGNVYVSDTTNNTIRQITPAGAVTTLAGLAGVAGSADGVGSNALFNRPMGLAVDTNGTLYATDTGNSTIRQITPAGVVTTLAGLPTIAGLMDGKGSTAFFNQPEALCIFGPAGQQFLVVADTGNAAIRNVGFDGSVWTLELYQGEPVVWPATVATTTSTTGGTSPAGTTSSGSSSSGGGSLDGCLVSLLGLAGLLRWRGGRAKTALF